MKRFLQGLGAGILATTLVFTVAYYTVGNSKMSDKEIMNKARKLGMVQPTEAPLFSDGNKEDITNNEQNQNVGEQQTDNNNAAQDAPQDNQNPEGQPQNNDETEGTSDNSQEGSEEEPPSAPQEDNSDGTVKLTINEGDGATVVSWRLKELGIVSDAMDFDRYLRNNSKSHIIQIGTFELRPGMNYEEVADIISGS